MKCLLNLGPREDCFFKESSCHCSEMGGNWDWDVSIEEDKMVNGVRSNWVEPFMRACDGLVVVMEDWRV